MENQQTGQAADRGTIDSREGLKGNYVQSRKRRPKPARSR